MSETLNIDGSYGEGGGQLLRTALSLSVISGRPLHIRNIRANRRNPGLAAQHLTGVRAAAQLCGARLAGAELGSKELHFSPTHPARAGSYHFDVADARPGGSAGATSLVLQTVLPPLVLAKGDSIVTLRGGTHNAWSPPFDYLRDVWLPTLARFGVEAAMELQNWGWYPVGRGAVLARIQGRGRRPLKAVDLSARGDLRRIRGRAVAANLPAHIPERMVERATALLAGLGAPLEVGAEQVSAACPGAGIFLTAEYGEVLAGFSALGERGKPSEEVAEEAAQALLSHHYSGAALEPHLADQLLLPMALAGGVSKMTVERLSRHLKTNAWVIERFSVARVEMEEAADGTGLVTVAPGAG